MRIYIDEGGNFQVITDREYSLSLVAALVVPACHEKELFYQFLRLRDEWGLSAIEIKGSRLDEDRLVQVITLLDSHDVLLEFKAIDMASHTEEDLNAFRLHQANKLDESVTPLHQPGMIADMRKLAQAVRDTPNQLFVQAFIMMHLLSDVVQTSTLYYCQRLPQELGQFDWVVDAKDRVITSMEKLWTTLIIPVGQTRALNEKFLTLRGADYSHFERFRIDADDPEKAQQIRWVEENIRFDLGQSRKAANMKQILQESFRFAHSENELGLQLVDIIASACRRGFNGNLQRLGWEKVGKLMVKKNGPPPIMALATPAQAAKRSKYLHDDPSSVWLALDAAAKSMWVKP